MDAAGRRRVPLRVVSATDASTGAGPYQRYGKRAFDLVVGGLLLLVASPVLLVVAVAVLVTLGRPVFYTQTRVGRGGAPFEIVKFRSMHPSRRHVDLPYDGPDRRQHHKSEDDPRHTRLGRFLRHTSLDELPQLLNVVKGDMSLVGPRPELWDIAIDHDLVHHPRHRVRPGITGPRQVSHLRNAPIYLDPDFDLIYVDDIRLTTDLKLLAATVGAVLRPTGT